MQITPFNHGLWHRFVFSMASLDNFVSETSVSVWHSLASSSLGQSTMGEEGCQWI